MRQFAVHISIVRKLSGVRRHWLYYLIYMFFESVYKENIVFSQEWIS